MNKAFTLLSFPMNSTFSRKGFTLIELLVVIGIILIVSSVILSMGNVGASQSLSSSQRIVSGMIQGARLQAVNKSSDVRLIINNDPAQKDSYRRLFGIIIHQEDDTSTADDEEGWVSVNTGTLLPKGIYFDAVTSSSKSSLSAAKNMKFTSLSLSKPQKSSVGSDHYYYEFNSNGTVKSANEWLVLRAAAMIPESTKVKELKVHEDQEYVRAALILRRSGSVTFVENPESIEDSGGSIAMSTEESKPSEDPEESD